jgi:hypothetical protein
VRAVAGRSLLRGRIAGRKGLCHGVVVIPVLDTEGLKRSEEGVAGLSQGNTVLRAPRTGKARLDGAEVEVDDLGVRGLGLLVVEEELRAAVALDARDVLVASARHAEIGQGLLVDGEEAARRAVLRRHVRDRRAVGERQAGQAAPEVLHELADDSELAEGLGHGQDEVGSGRALGQAAGEPEPHDLRHEHGERLAEHRGLRLDSADAPAQDAEAVHHRRVRVGADERVREGPAIALLDHAREVLEVDLMDDAGVRRHHAQVVEGPLAPAEEGVALPVALELELRVLEDRELRAEDVHLNGVVDDELRRKQRIDPTGLPAQIAHRVPHGGEIDDRGDAGEVLEQNPRGAEGNLPVGIFLGLPRQDRSALFLLAGTQDVLEQDAERVRQARDLLSGGDLVETRDTGLCHRYRC